MHMLPESGCRGDLEGALPGHEMVYPLEWHEIAKPVSTKTVDYGQHGKLYQGGSSARNMLL